MFNIYKKINPVEHTRAISDVKKYKVEPYVVSADIYSEGKLAGRGGWTWYTGSSAWLYEAQIKYILGISIKGNKMTINPQVPNDWDKFEVSLKWKNAIYNLNFNHSNKYAISASEGLNVKNKEISLKDEGSYTININYE